jgi:hypothetical protein
MNKKRFQFPKSNPGTIEELSHLPSAHDGQITAKQHAIETGKHAMNPILIAFDEFFHCFNPLPPSNGRDHRSAPHPPSTTVKQVWSNDQAKK